jgi:teichuronic acid biosynthesis glycosyltransferase TuaG
MPIYNGVEFFEVSYGSVQSQTLGDWELIIAVNGHPPNSEIYQRLKTFESDKVHVYDMPDIKGKSQALNAMVPLCKYDWLAMLDVDDFWEPSKLQIQHGYLADYDVIGTSAVAFGRFNLIIPTPPGDLQNFDFVKTNPIVNSSTVFKKDIVHWESEFDGVEDYYLWIKLKQEGKKFYNVPVILAHHRLHDGSAYNTTLGQKMEAWGVNQATLGNFLLTHMNNKS